MDNRFTDLLSIIQKKKKKQQYLLLANCIWVRLATGSQDPSSKTLPISWEQKKQLTNRWEAVGGVTRQPASKADLASPAKTGAGRAGQGLGIKKQRWACQLLWPWEESLWPQGQLQTDSSVCTHMSMCSFKSSLPSFMILASGFGWESSLCLGDQRGEGPIYKSSFLNLGGLSLLEGL